MYAADEQDDRVYSYNMPDASIALLSSLEISDVDFGVFSPSVLDYQGALLGGATVSTVDARSAYEGATISIQPLDVDAAGEPGIVKRRLE